MGVAACRDPGHVEPLEPTQRSDVIRHSSPPLSEVISALANRGLSNRQIVAPGSQEAIGGMLAENELPVSDRPAAWLRDFAVAEDTDGSVVGSVGCERC